MSKRIEILKYIVLLIIITVSIKYIENKKNIQEEKILILKESIEQQKQEKEVYKKELEEALMQIQNYEIKIYELKCDL